MLFLRRNSRCISFDSYIKPQPVRCSRSHADVVYLLIPTSNHNSILSWLTKTRLYIFWFLHQTTTVSKWKQFVICCISFDSYIKPQRSGNELLHITVVYLLIPTSNHNSGERTGSLSQLYIFWFLHQTTTKSLIGAFRNMLYIFWFLHQTTTSFRENRWKEGCISFDSYIKPQRRHPWAAARLVVYLLIPTSNHNFKATA